MVSPPKSGGGDRRHAGSDRETSYPAPPGGPSGPAAPPGRASGRAGRVCPDEPHRQGHGPLAGRRGHADHRRWSAAPSRPTASTARTWAGSPGPSPPPTWPATPTGSPRPASTPCVLDACMNFAINAALPGKARTRGTLEMKTECMRPAMKGDAYALRGEVVRLAKQVAYGEATVRDGDGVLVSRATGTFLLHRPDPDTALPSPPDPFRVPASRARGRAASAGARAAAANASASPAGWWPAASACRSAPVVPVRLCPLPSPLYTVLLGLQGVAGGRGPAALRRHGAGARVRLPARRSAGLARGSGGRPARRWCSRSPRRAPAGPAPLAGVDGLAGAWLAALPAARWAPALLRRAEAPDGPPPVAHMRPDRGGLRGAPRTAGSGVTARGAAARRHLRQRRPVPERRRRARTGRSARHVIVAARPRAAPRPLAPATPPSWRRHARLRAGCESRLQTAAPTE